MTSPEVLLGVLQFELERLPLGATVVFSQEKDCLGLDDENYVVMQVWTDAPADGWQSHGHLYGSGLSVRIGEYERFNPRLESSVSARVGDSRFLECAAMALNRFNECAVELES